MTMAVKQRPPYHEWRQLTAHDHGGPIRAPFKRHFRNQPTELDSEFGLKPSPGFWSSSPALGIYPAARSSSRADHVRSCDPIGLGRIVLGQKIINHRFMSACGPVKQAVNVQVRIRAAQFSIVASPLCFRKFTQGTEGHTAVGRPSVRPALLGLSPHIPNRRAMRSRRLHFRFRCNDTVPSRFGAGSRASGTIRSGIHKYRHNSCTPCSRCIRT